PKFIHKKKRMKGVLEDRLIHECLNIILEPLKQAAQRGVMLSDPTGHSRYCFTTLASYIADTPEAMMLATVGGKNVASDDVFFDHDAQWLINAVGDSEIDFRFSVLQPITGHRRFHGGISKLKQVTGRLRMQHLLVSIAALRALMQFRYLVQSPRIDEEDLGRISRALNEFHANKDAIIAAGVHQGKGNRVINNFYIPKLELMPYGLPTSLNTPTLQRSKTPLDRAITTIMTHKFVDTSIAPKSVVVLSSLPACWIHEQRVEEEGLDLDAEEIDIDVDTQDNPIDPTRHPHQITNYFSITVDEVAITFGLPDLRQAIADFLQREATYGQRHVHAIGGPRRAGPGAVLPFDKVQVWFKIRLQEMDLHDTHAIKPAQTLNFAPPNDPWILGHYDTVIAETSAGFSWPSSRLSGHTITQIRLIMRPIGKSGLLWSWKDRFLTYVQCFDLSNDRDPTTTFIYSSERNTQMETGWAMLFRYLN
ncbi:hypothetical protein DEU56DRAFT_756971, partial [Suillus clintonianus]|uniref:uncharacterized protein n=1 Tax=Suillus clintonianus TaxID=1904413 RepID=UPI001B8870AA